MCGSVCGFSSLIFTAMLNATHYKYNQLDLSQLRCLCGFVLHHLFYPQSQAVTGSRNVLDRFRAVGFHCFPHLSDVSVQHWVGPHLVEHPRTAVDEVAVVSQSRLADSPSVLLGQVALVVHRHVPIDACLDGKDRLDDHEDQVRWPTESFDLMNILSCDFIELRQTREGGNVQNLSLVDHSFIVWVEFQANKYLKF